MKIRKFSRMLSILLSLMMLSTIILGTIPITSAAVGDALAFIDDTRDELNGSEQVGRIIQASSNPNSANWGAEPMVFTFYLNDYDVDLSVDIADPTVVAVDSSYYRATPGTDDFFGTNGNLLVLNPLKVGNTKVTVTATRGTGGEGNVATCSFQVVINLYEDTGEYDWGNFFLPGSGALCGYVFHPTAKDADGYPILYAQVDTCGMWKYNFKNGVWEDLTKWISMTSNQATGWGQARGLGVDPTPGRESWVYMAGSGSLTSTGAGTGTGSLLLSQDYGHSWTPLNSIGINMFGNGGTYRNMRGLGGDNLVSIPQLKPGAQQGSTDPADYDEPIMYAVSDNGIRRATAKTGLNPTWVNIASLFNNVSVYTGVYYCLDNYDLQLVATAVKTGGGAYYSYDNGVTFAPLPGQPAARMPTGNFGFYFPCRAAFTKPINAAGDRYLFVTYADDGNSLGVTDGDGDDGCIFRWIIGADGQVKANNADGSTYTDGTVNGVNVTPQMVHGTPVWETGATTAAQNRMGGVGFSSLAIDHNNPGTLICGTFGTDPYNADKRYTRRGMETIFRSLDYGETWFPVLCGFEMFGDLAFGERTPFAAPTVNGEYNTNMLVNDPARQAGNAFWWEPWTFQHWNFGSKLNPFDSDNLFINSGMGSYMTFNLSALDDIAGVPGNAQPNVMLEKGLTVEQARAGLFTTTGGSANGAMVITTTGADRRVTSKYEAFLYENCKSSASGLERGVANGQRKLDELVKWETRAGLNSSVQKQSAIYSPPTGRNIVVACTWDYPGWAWKSLDFKPWNGFSMAQWIPAKWDYMYESWRQHTADTDPKFLPPKPSAHPYNGEYSDIYAPTNRGISGDSADFADLNPNIMVCASRGDWHHVTKGGALISFDGGLIWHNLPNGWTAAQPNGVPAADHPSFALLGAASQGALAGWATLSTTTDRSAGFLSMGADGKTIFWITTATIANIRRTYADDPINLGKVWITPTFYNTTGGTMATTTAMKVVSDRVLPNVFYGVSTVAPYLWMSTDYGANFQALTISGTTPTGWTTSVTGLQDALRLVRGVTGKPYTIHISGGGLIEIVVNPTAMTATVTQRVSGTGLSTIEFSGYGLGPNAGGVGIQGGALYAHMNRNVTGTQGGMGIYRSLDGGATWLKISPTSATNNSGFTNDNWAFGDNRGVTGDPRVFGRVYTMTGNTSGGPMYGDMIVRLLEDGSFADYSGLDQAILDAADYGPANKYTVASFGALTNAVAAGMAVPRGMDYTGQATIDAATQAILDAISGLAPYYLILGSGQFATITVRKGYTTKINVDTNCTDVSFTSAVSVFATVSPDGVVTGVMPGISVIRITDSVSGLSINVAVNVIN